MVQEGDSPDSPPDCVMASATPLLQHGTTARSASLSPVFLELTTLGIRLGPAKACAPVARARQITALYEGRMVMDFKLVHLVLYFYFLFRGLLEMCRRCSSRYGVFHLSPHDRARPRSRLRRGAVAVMSVSPPLETDGAYIFDASTFFKGLRSIALRNLSLRCASIAPRKLRNTR